jgi:hypothetical protein
LPVGLGAPEQALPTTRFTAVQHAGVEGLAVVTPAKSV